MRRFCTDTVTLFHYLGEVDRKASYEAFVLKNVRLEESRATGNGTAGKTPADTAALYILDRYASSQEWGLSDDGRDMFCPGEAQKPGGRGDALSRVGCPAAQGRRVRV